MLAYKQQEGIDSGDCVRSLFDNLLTMDEAVRSALHYSITEAPTLSADLYAGVKERRTDGIRTQTLVGQFDFHIVWHSSSPDRSNQIPKDDQHQSGQIHPEDLEPPKMRPDRYGHSLPSRKARNLSARDSLILHIFLRIPVTSP